MTSDPRHQQRDRRALPAEVWSPATEQWTTLASNQVPRYYHSTAVLLPDGRVLIGGGWGGAGGTDDRQHNYEIFSPPYLFKGARPTITSAPGSVGYSSSFTVGDARRGEHHQGGADRAGRGDPQLRRERPLRPAELHPDRRRPPDHRARRTATTRRPGPYMLFLVNNNGVPSVASWVNVG